MTIDVSLIPQNRVENLISKLSEIENNIGNIGTDITNNVVHKTGNETISGEKTFQNNITAPNQIDYTNITNCITEIPQDIKLELNDGTLTLKAGSKVYIPNGPGVFDVVTIANDINYRFTFVPSSNSSVMLFINQSGTEFVYLRLEAGCVSGETQPSGNYINWYKSNENRMYSIGNNATIEGSDFSFPIAKITQGSDGVTKSIDQVFNGFGYIGSTVYALPGVKGLIPNGRNADGSLKNTEFTVNNVISKTYPQNIGTGWLALNATDLGVVNFTYNEVDNYVYNNNSKAPYINRAGYMVAKTSGKITSFTPKTVFHALDYNDFSDLKNTVDTNDSNVVPKTGVVSGFVKETWKSGTSWYRIWSDGWIEQGGHFSWNGAWTTLTFNRPFTTTNYYINGGGYRSDSSPYQCMIDFKDWGTSSCSVWSSDDNTSNPCVMKWYACGY